MRLAQLRGVVAFIAVAGAIAFAWTTIENRTTDEATAATTTTSTTTTTLVVTTTTSPEQSLFAICDRSELFVAQSQLIPADTGPGPLANLSLIFWRDIREVATPDLATEVVAIIAYYEDYLATRRSLQFRHRQDHPRRRQGEVRAARHPTGSRYGADARIDRNPL